MNTRDTSPLLDRIRRGVIGEGETLRRPVRPAADHLRRLHRVGPFARLRRRLHPRLVAVLELRLPAGLSTRAGTLGIAAVVVARIAAMIRYGDG
jgi:hypothetical protein